MIYTIEQLNQQLDIMLALPAETEWFEFKKIDRCDTSEIGEYFSALSNEANLKGKEFGWLVFGINDKTHQIEGTSYRSGNRKYLDDLKKDIANLCELSFVEIYELQIDNNRVIMFQIPPAIPGYPTKSNGHMYGRNGEHKGALNSAEIDMIKSQTAKTDWTADIISELSFNDIDLAAIELGKSGYINKHPDLAPEMIKGRDIQTFLSKIYALRNGRITRAAALLFGKKDAIAPLFPWLEMSWILKDNNGNPIAHEHFKSPFVLSASLILSKIRILPQTFLPDGTLMPIEISSYDDRVLRELLANAICHQDYNKQGRIGVQEFPNHLVFSNEGNFYSGSIQKVVEQEDFIPSSYRNPCLKDIMSEIKMIEYAGSGLRKVFMKQKEKYMPMPEDLSTSGEVKIRLEGKIIDEKYSKILYYNTSLSLMDIINLDKVQKNKSIQDDIAKNLKIKGLIEGRKPHYHISLGVAKKTNQIGEYLDAKGPELNHQKERIQEFIKTKGSVGATKKEIVMFMNSKLEGILGEEEKYNRITNLLQELRRDGRIKPDSKGAHAKRFNI